MAYDVQTLTVSGAALLAAATAADKLILVGCDATDTAISQSDAVNVVDRPYLPMSTTTRVVLEGSDANHIFVHVMFVAGESTGGEAKTLYLYGHSESSPSSNVVIAVLSSNDGFHLPETGDVANTFGALFDVIYTPESGAIETVDSSVWATKTEFDRLNSRAVTCHKIDDTESGDTQVIYGYKYFRDPTWHTAPILFTLTEGMIEGNYHYGKTLLTCNGTLDSYTGETTEYTVANSNLSFLGETDEASVAHLGRFEIKDKLRTDGIHGLESHTRIVSAYCNNRGVIPDDSHEVSLVECGFKDDTVNSKRNGFARLRACCFDDDTLDKRATILLESKSDKNSLTLDLDTIYMPYENQKIATGSDPNLKYREASYLLYGGLQSIKELTYSTTIKAGTTYDVSNNFALWSVLAHQASNNFAQIYVCAAPHSGDKAYIGFSVADSVGGSALLTYEFSHTSSTTHHFAIKPSTSAPSGYSTVIDLGTSTEKFGTVWAEDHKGKLNGTDNQIVSVANGYFEGIGPRSTGLLFERSPYLANPVDQYFDLRQIVANIVGGLLNNATHPSTPGQDSTYGGIGMLGLYLLTGEAGTYIPGNIITVGTLNFYSISIHSSVNLDTGGSLSFTQNYTNSNLPQGTKMILLSSAKLESSTDSALVLAVKYQRPST